MSQIEVYTERVKRTVGKVLTGNDIACYEQGAYGLVGGEGCQPTSKTRPALHLKNC